METKYLSYPIMANGFPGVMKSNGKAITAANIGMKRVVLKKKNLGGIFDATERMMTSIKRMTSDVTVLAETAVNIKAIKQQNFIRGSIP